jgi:hypothetical protein
MDKNQSFAVTLAVLYGFLAFVLAVGFDVDIYSWWTVPAFEAFSALIRHIQEFFRIA